MLQYVVAGVAESSSDTDDEGVFFITIKQAQTNDDSTSHFDAVRINGKMLMLDGEANCPQIYHPASYSFVTKDGHAEPFDIRSFDPELKVTRDADVKGFRDWLSTFNIYLTLLKPGQIDGQEAAAGWMVLISGKLTALHGIPLRIEMFTCACTIDPQGSKHVGLTYPHPLLVTVTVAANGEADRIPLVGYYPAVLAPLDNKLDGLLLMDPTEEPKPYAIRRYYLAITNKGEVSSAALEKLTRP